MSDILLSLDYRIRRCQSLKNKADNLNNHIQRLANNIEETSINLQVISESSEYYKKSQDILYSKSIGSLKTLIDSALSFIFYDKNYEVVIDLTDKRGSKNLSFKIKDIDQDLEVSLKNGCGNGVRSVISAILNIFVLLNKDSRILILDEKYSHISSDYIENFFTFLSKICKERDFRIIMVTHDTRFLMYADKKYRINDGRVEEVI